MARNRRRHPPVPMWRAGKASNYIKPLSDIKPGDRVVLWCRVSRRTQNRRGNLRDQAADMARVVAKCGAVVIDTVSHVGDGSDPVRLARAAYLAKGYGAKILAESTNRLIRHPDYESERRPELRANEIELRELAFHTHGVTLVTVVPPDATASEERRHETKRGQRLKDRKGGRPMVKRPGYKKLRKRTKLPEVVACAQRGMSLAKIATKTGVPKSTVRNWLNRAIVERNMGNC